MATTADIRNGLVIDHKGKRMKIVSFLHVKPGKGGAFVRTKLKNIVTGQTVEKTFRAGAKIVPVRIESKKMQYLYSDSYSLIFMDFQTYEQESVPISKFEDESKFLVEGMTVNVSIAENEIIGLSPPNFVELKVSETDPGVRGNTAQGGSKPAVLENGVSVSVPLFVNIGEKIKIDTRTGEYVERVK